MAIMIPPQEPERGPGKRAERQLFFVLRECLPDDFWVFYDFRFVGDRANENQIDFLIVHRLLGMLVIECKGDGVRITRDGRWTRETDHGTAAMTETPFDQAQRQIKGLVHELKKRMAGSFPSHFPFVHGHAAAFPFASQLGDGLPMSVPHEILFVADDIARARDWVERAFAYWRQAAHPKLTALSEKDFTRFRRQVLVPACQLIETIGAKACNDRAAIERQSDDQIETLSGSLVNHRLLVAGAAGTGKTALAVAAAQRLAYANQRVLLVCYNAGLAAHLAGVFARDGGFDGCVDVMTFHDLCRRAVEAAGRAWIVPEEKEEARRFWEHEAPELLFDAATSGKATQYDAIIVDEAQDFADHWAMGIEASLKDRERGVLLVFYDPGQRIFDRKWELLERSAKHELRVNFRNTRKIAEAVSAVGKVDYRFLSSAPVGEDVKLAMNTKGTETPARVDELVRDLVGKGRIKPDDIVVLSPRTRANSCLSGMTELGGVPLAEKSTDRAGRVLHTTIGAFKGLESDVVILVDVDGTTSLCDARARYVAASRAKVVLFVFGRGEWVRG